MALSKIQTNSITDGNITTAKIADTAVHGYRNLIRNGACTISQRGSTFSNASHNVNTIDGFTSNWSLGGWTITQDSNAPNGFSKSFKIVPDSAATPTGSDYAVIDLRIEAQDLHRLDYGTSNAQTLVLSFWVKSNVTGQYAMNAFASDGDAGGARQRNSAYTINSSDVWEYKTIIIPGDTDALAAINDDNGEGFRITFFLCVGTTYSGGTTDTWANWVYANFGAAQQANVKSSTSNYWQITGVQLEVGSEATPFEHRPYGDELARCQRYYYELGGQNYYPYSLARAISSTLARPIFQHPVPMRASPAISAINLSSIIIEGVPLTNLNIDIMTPLNAMLNAYVSSGLTAGDCVRLYDTGTGVSKIQFKAEL